MGTFKDWYRVLDSLEERAILCKALGDKPDTVIWTHLLRRGNCIVYVAGEPLRYEATVVQANDLPAEPTGFGAGVSALWELLKLVKGWNCVLVDKQCASALGQIIRDEMGVQVRYLDDINYVLPGQVPTLPNPAVRRFAIEDLKLLESLTSELRSGFWGSTHALLTQGIAAGAISEGHVVSIALVSVVSERYADIGVYTLPDFRGRGFATAAASIVARLVKGIGKTPIWSTGEHNIPSQRIAEKLGFVEILRRTYVVLENSPSFTNAKDTSEGSGLK